MIETRIPVRTIQYSSLMQAGEAMGCDVVSICKKSRPQIRIWSQASIFPALLCQSLAVFYTLNQFSSPFPLPDVFTSHLYTSHLSVRAQQLPALMLLNHAEPISTFNRSEFSWILTSFKRRCSNLLGCGAENVMGGRWTGIHWHLRGWTHYQKQRENVGRGMGGKEERVPSRGKHRWREGKAREIAQK